MMRSSKGFTIIEMMIVIAIIGILSMIAVPDFLGLTSRARLKSAARDIVSNMQLARVKAIRDGSPWAVQFDTGDARYRVLSNKGADGNWNTGDDTVYKTVNLSDYSGVSYGSDHGPRATGLSDPADGVSFNSHNSNRAIFNSNGTSSAGIVYVKNGDGDTFAVGAASAAGRVKAWRNYGSGWEG